MILGLPLPNTHPIEMSLALLCTINMTQNAHPAVQTIT